MGLHAVAATGVAEGLAAPAHADRIVVDHGGLLAARGDDVGGPGADGRRLRGDQAGRVEREHAVRVRRSLEVIRIGGHAAVDRDDLDQRGTRGEREGGGDNDEERGSETATAHGEPLPRIRPR